MKQKKLIDKETKERLISALNTFIAGFVLTVGGMIYVSDLDTNLLNSAFWYSVGLSGVRAGVKAVGAYIVSFKKTK